MALLQQAFKLPPSKSHLSALQCAGRAAICLSDLQGRGASPNLEQLWAGGVGVYVSTRSIALLLFAHSTVLEPKYLIDSMQGDQVQG